MSEMNSYPVWPGWETVRLIGRGSFGAVYEIQRDVFGSMERAALKVITIPQHESDIQELYDNGYDDESITAVFNAHMKSIVNEYALMRKLNGSANVVSCDDFSCIAHDGSPGWDILIRMELLTPLPKALPVLPPEEQVIRVGRDMSRALVLCRKYSIIHRDIKPQNIFVSPNGDYKLGDFGIAKTVEKTSGGTKIGTYEYMAPEVYHGQPYGSAADIYSLGIVLYWLLNERRAPFFPLPPGVPTSADREQARVRRFGGETIPVPAHGSSALQRIVLKACAYRPEDRYHSAADMLADLEALDRDKGSASVTEITGIKTVLGKPTTDPSDEEGTALIEDDDARKTAEAKKQERKRRAREEAERKERERKAREETERKERERRAREEAERQERERKAEEARKQALYEEACAKMAVGTADGYKAAAADLKKLGRYRDAEALAAVCRSKLSVLRGPVYKKVGLAVGGVLLAAALIFFVPRLLVFVQNRIDEKNASVSTAAPAANPTASPTADGTYSDTFQSATVCARGNDVTARLVTPGLQDTYTLRPLAEGYAGYNWYVTFTDGNNEYQFEVNDFISSDDAERTETIYDMETKFGMIVRSADSSYSVKTIADARLEIDGDTLVWTATVPEEYGFDASRIAFVEYGICDDGRGSWGPVRRSYEEPAASAEPVYTDTFKDASISVAGNAVTVRLVTPGLRDTYALQPPAEGAAGYTWRVSFTDGNTEYMVTVERFIGSNDSAFSGSLFDMARVFGVVEHTDKTSHSLQSIGTPTLQVDGSTLIWTFTIPEEYGFDASGVTIQEYSICDDGSNGWVPVRRSYEEPAASAEPVYTDTFKDASISVQGNSVTVSLVTPGIRDSYVMDPSLAENDNSSWVLYSWYINFTDGNNVYQIELVDTIRSTDPARTDTIYDMYSHLSVKNKYEKGSYTTVSDAPPYVEGNVLTWMFPIPEEYGFDPSNISILSYVIHDSVNDEWLSERRSN